MDHARGNDPLRKPSPYPFHTPTPFSDPSPVEHVADRTRVHPESEWLGHLYERLLAKRVILAHGRLDDAGVTTLAAQLLTLDAESVEPIHLHLHVPDADALAAVTLIDVLDQMVAPVYASALGEVGGAALGILAAAPIRRAAPHVIFRLAEPGGGLLRPGLTATAAELGAEADRRKALLDILYGRIAARAGRTAEEVSHDVRQKRYLTAVEALEYGLVDEIAVPPPHAIG